MARDGSGTYTRVSNTFSNPQAQTVISPTDAESFFDELDTEITDSLSRSGKGGMSATAVLKIADGTSAAPALSFNLDTDTGIARTTANTMVAVASGVAVITFTPTGATIPSPTITAASIPNYADFTEIASPANPAANLMRVFAKDVAGATHLFSRDSAGTEKDMTLGAAGGDMVSTNNGSDFADIATTRVNLAVQAARGGGPTLINGIFVPSAAAGALTVAIKTIATTDPSASDPVYVVIPDTINGDYDIIAITGATSLVLSSGSTLGVSSATPFNLHLIGFNDGGTFRLGAMNARTSTGIRSLVPGTRESSTAEGGAGAADTAGTIYTGTAVTTKDWTYLGRLEFPAGITTAGTWTWTTGSATGKIIPYMPGVKLPGEFLPGGVSKTSTGSATKGSATYADTDLTTSITPKSACNAVSIFTSGTAYADNGTGCVIRLTRAGGAIGLTALHQLGAGAFYGTMVLGPQLDWPGTASSTTYTIQHANTNATLTAHYPTAGGGVLLLTEVQG
jgi:hypothetical protein